MIFSVRNRNGYVCSEFITSDNCQLSAEAPSALLHSQNTQRAHQFLLRNTFSIVLNLEYEVTPLNRHFYQYLGRVSMASNVGYRFLEYTKQHGCGVIRQWHFVLWQIQPIIPMGPFRENCDLSFERQ